LACEGGPIRVFHRAGTGFNEITGRLGLGNHRGWWNSVNAGDFDGDGRFDFGIARNSGGQMTHWQLRSTQGVVAFPYGLNTDKYATGDFDADGRTDIAAVRANGSVFDWYVLKSSTLQTIPFSFGNPTTDYLVPADYDGDGKTDFAVWRSQSGYFLTVNSSSSPQSVQWGSSASPLTAPDYPVANFRVK